MRYVNWGVIAGMALGSIVATVVSAQTIATGEDVRAVQDGVHHPSQRQHPKGLFRAGLNGPHHRGRQGATGKWTIEKNTICHDLSSERKCYTVNRKEPDTFQLQSTDFKWLPTYKMVAGNPDKL
jgi:hypothetical protein